MFFQFKITLLSNLREPVTAVLYDHGCTGIEERDDALIAYFPDTVNPDKIIAALSAFDGLTVSREAVEEKDWQAAWKERFECVRAEGFLICPPWKIQGNNPATFITPPLSPSYLKMGMKEGAETGYEGNERLLLIDPGNAFGAGDHITTLTVLTLLRQWAAAQDNLAGKSLLDVGTGTGILAIAARMMGVVDVTAVDTDKSSVEAAEKNFALNDITDGARVIHGSVRDAGAAGPYDIILANLFLEPLLELMCPVAAALKPGGALIISGLLAGQEGPVLNEAAKSGLSLNDGIVSADGGRSTGGGPTWFSGMLMREEIPFPSPGACPERSRRDGKAPGRG